MRINRLFEMVYLLIEKKNMTARKLADHFEVSSRTILRDVETLSAAGIPIYASQGKGGGISIMDNYVLNKAVISEDEQNQILFALQSLSATQHIKTENILGRLQSLFEKTDINWIEVDFSRWGHSTPDQTKFEQLKNAVINRQALSFTYSSTYGETSGRKVYPLKLVFKSKSWYLQAFCLPKENYRTFRISRMKNLKMLTETFEGQAFEIPGMEACEYQSSDLIDIKMQFDSAVAYRVYDEFDEQTMIRNEDGSFILTAKLPNDEWLYDYILSFGASAEVLAPQNVRDEMARRADKIKVRYRAKI